MVISEAPAGSVVLENGQIERSAVDIAAQRSVVETVVTWAPGNALRARCSTSGVSDTSRIRWARSLSRANTSSALLSAGERIVALDAQVAVECSLPGSASEVKSTF